MYSKLEQIDIGNIHLFNDSYLNFLNEIDINADVAIIDPPPFDHIGLWNNDFKEFIDYLTKKLKNNAHIYFFCNEVREILEIGLHFEIDSVLIYSVPKTSKINNRQKYIQDHKYIVFIGDEMRDLRATHFTNFGLYKMKNKFHKEEIPKDLITELIKNSTAQNEIVLDPFMGGGAVAEATNNLDRQYYGCEFDGQSFSIAHGRILKGTTQTNIFEQIENQ